MKLNHRLFFAAAVALSVCFTSCKKDKTDSTTTNDNLASHSDDQSNVANATDDVANDANNIIDNKAAFNGRTDNTASFFNMPCNATATMDSTNTTRRIRIVYDGNNCSGTRNRVGTVTLSIPLTQHWGDVGAVLTIETQGLTITRLSDGKSITINGTETITNVTGGRLFELATHGPIIHEIASPGITVTFDNGSHRDWQIAKRRTFTYDNGVVSSTVGTHSDGTNNDISEWGTNRFGNAFTTSITSPMIIRQDCNFRLTGGQVTHHAQLGTVVATFGLDSTGNPTPCPGNAPYYMKAVWTGNNGNVQTYIYPY